MGGNEFVPNFYQLTVKDAHDYNGQRSFGSFLMNHLDTMIQRGPDNVEGSKYTSEVSMPCFTKIFEHGMEYRVVHFVVRYLAVFIEVVGDI